MPARHHLIWIADAGWQRLQAGTADLRQRAVLAQWQRNGWPVVACRADTDAEPDALCVGIALPPDAQGNKPRIALRIKSTDVMQRRAPLPLREIAAAPGLPPDWPAALANLEEEAMRAGIALAVFGSLAWQAITGQPYVRAGSDIDLLFSPASRTQLEQGMRLLNRHALTLPLDGEIVFPDGAAVSWKEWRQVTDKGIGPDSQVLVKMPDAVRMARVATLAASLPEGEARCAA